MPPETTGERPRRMHACTQDSSAPVKGAAKFRWLGCALIIAAALANPHFLGKLSPDGRITHPLFLVLILLFEAGVGGAGLYLVMRPARNSLLNLTLLALTLALLAVSAEAVTRVYFFGTAAFSPQRMGSLRVLGEGLLLRPSEHPRLRTELLPNLDTEYHLAPVRTTADGLHDVPVPVTKPGGVFRVAVLGDSFTFPVGVPLSEAWHTILEQELGRSQPGLDVQCVNFGVPGYYLEQYLAVLELKAADYAPDLVLIGFCAENDHIPPEPGFFERPFVPQRRIHPMLRLWLPVVVHHLMHPHARMGKSPTPTEAAHVRRVFEALAAFAHKRGIPVLVAYLANLPRDAGHIRALAEGAGLRFVDAAALFEPGELGRYSIYHPIDSHPNGAANRVWAGRIAQAIEDAALLPQVPPGEGEQ